MIFNIAARLFVARNKGKIIVNVKGDEGWIAIELSKRQAMLLAQALAE